MKHMYKNMIGILKKMTKNPNSLGSTTWIESKKQMVSILSMQLQKQKMDDHTSNVHVKDCHMGIHSSLILSRNSTLATKYISWQI